MNSTISIIGCGWLGLPLAEYLQKKGFSIKGSTTTPSKLEELAAKGIQPFLLQLQGKDSQSPEQDTILSKLLQADILILNIPPGRKNPDVVSSFLTKIKTLLHAIATSPIQKIVFVSATSVYSLQNKVVTEVDAQNPTKTSGRALLQAEQLLQNCPNIETTILRLAGLYGPNRPAGRFLAGKKNLSNGEGRVNLVHQLDCIEVIYQIIRQEKWNKTFNVCSDDHPTRQTFYTEAAQKLRLPPPTFLLDSSAQYCIVSNEKVKTELGVFFRNLTD